MKRFHYLYWLAVVVLAGIVLAGGCAVPAPAPAAAPAGAGSWMDIELTDAATGQTFRISDFKGRPVLLESFAVWCPTCLRQQLEIAKVREMEGDAIVHISLDTDPNEDVSKVREHLERNGLDWYFAVSPIELTNALIDEFGLSVVNAPSAPVVLICADQSTRLLKSGVKRVDDLLAEIEEGCQ